MIKIAQGAEAIVYRNDTIIIKERIPKVYRLPHIDESLRKSRTRREAKILQKLQEIHFPAPVLQSVSEKNMTLEMDFIFGEKVRDVLEQHDFKKVAREIGRKIALLHQHNIVHGDLTTSNMILHNNEIYFIDFGLSLFSEKLEDKAVDLFLLDRALESKHYAIYPAVFAVVLEGYTQWDGAEKVLQRFKAVSKRGRNKK